MRACARLPVCASARRSSAALAGACGAERGPRQDLAPWILAGAVALMVSRGLGLGAPWPVLAGAFAGAALGATLDRRRETDIANR